MVTAEQAIVMVVAAVVVSTLTVPHCRMADLPHYHKEAAVATTLTMPHTWLKAGREDLVEAVSLILVSEIRLE